MRSPNDRRHRAGALALLLALAACSDGTAHTDEHAVQGVLLVVCDTLRADRLDPWGALVGTPNVSRLAAAGTRWEDNRSQSCWTLPSMLSMMTGRWIPQHSKAMPKAQPTLAELLREADFATAAFVANPVCDVDRGFQRGFEKFKVYAQGTTATDLAGEFETWYRSDERKSGERWFAWVHAMDPHTPYDPQPERVAARPPTPRKGQLELWRSSIDVVGERQPSYAAKKLENGFAHVQDERAAYDGEVREFDDGLGALLDLLEREGDLDSTLIVLASDHGEMLYEYRNYPGVERAILEERGDTVGLQGLFVTGHVNWFYPELWNTPLVFAGPGVARGATAHGLSGNLDIVPTVLAATGVVGPGDLEGESLLGRTSIDREHVFANGRDVTAVLASDGAYWVEVPREASGIADPARPSGFLHRLVERFAQPTDLAAREPERVRELRDRIDAWRAAATFELNMDVDQEADRVLIELGYIDEGEFERGDDGGGASDG